MHTHRRWKQPPLTVSWILRALPKGGLLLLLLLLPLPLLLLFLALSRGPTAQPFPFSPPLRPSISCYFIVLRLNSGSRRLYRYRVTYAHVSSTCKEIHIHVRNSRGDTRTIHTYTRKHTYTHSRARSRIYSHIYTRMNMCAARGARGVYADTPST